VILTEKAYEQEKSNETHRNTQKVVSLLIKEDKQKLFDLIKKLNARQQYSALAQRLLAEVLPRFSPDELIEEFKDSKKLSELVEAMQLYSDKHYARTDKHLKQSYFVHFVMNQMTLQEDTKVLEEAKPSVRKRDAKKKEKTRERRVSSISFE
jgi:hypothetical protein